MNNGYVIQWRSKVNGRAGRGTKIFGREGAQRLVQELNGEFPEIEHEAVSAREASHPHRSAPEPEPASASASSSRTNPGPDPLEEPQALSE
jgi:hypothetical protein